MKLPNGSLATVDERKVADYLLNSTHPDNGGKAAFFRALGYSVQSTASLRLALLELAREGNVVHHVESVHGRKYVVDGVIKAPAGKSAMVRTVWIVDTGDTVPRLVTAYPGE